LLRSPTNGQHDALQIIHHIVVGEPEHTISTRGKPCIAAIVVANTFFEIMTFAVELNDEFAGVRDKICNVVAHRALSAKPETGEPVLGARHFPP
jgi:hypothetical protein